MKIGIFTDTYYPSTDGVTTSLSQYKRSLEQLGHEVYVFAPKYPGYHDQEKNIIRLKAFDVILADKHRSVLIYPGLVKSLQGINLDIVHSQSLLGMGLVADMIAKDKQIPHIHTVHTLYPELADHYPAVLSASLVMAALIYPLYFKTKIPTIKQPISQSSSKVFLKRQSWKIMLLFCNSTNAIIVPSQHLLDKMVTRGLKRKTFILPNPIDNDFYHHASFSGQQHDDQPFKLITVGRVSEEKRHFEAIQAVISLNDHVNCQLTVVGDGPMLKKYKILTQKSPHHEKIIFTGKKDRTQVRDLLAKSDAFILPSYGFDNQPVAILEAISSGLPIIYCDPDLREGLSSANSRLTDSPNPDKIAQAIEELALDPKLRKKMATASIKESKQYDASKLTRQLIQIYQQTIRDYQSSKDLK